MEDATVVMLHDPVMIQGTPKLTLDEAGLKLEWFVVSEPLQNHAAITTAL